MQCFIEAANKMGYSPHVMKTKKSKPERIKMYKPRSIYKGEQFECWKTSVTLHSPPEMKYHNLEHKFENAYEHVHPIINLRWHVLIEKLVNVEIKISIIQQTLGPWCKTDVLSGWRVALSLGSEVSLLILIFYRSTSFSCTIDLASSHFPRCCGD